MSRIITITKTGDTVTLFSPRVDAVFQAEDIGAGTQRVTTRTELRVNKEENSDEKTKAFLRSRTERLVNGIAELSYNMWDSFNDFEVVVNIDERTINVMNESFIVKCDDENTSIKPLSDEHKKKALDSVEAIKDGLDILMAVSGFYKE